MHDEVTIACRLTPHGVGEARLFRVDEALREIADPIRQRFEREGERSIVVEGLSPPLGETRRSVERLSKVTQPSIDASLRPHNLTASRRIAASCSEFKAAALRTDTGTPSSVSISISN